MAAKFAALAGAGLLAAGPAAAVDLSGYGSFVQPGRVIQVAAGDQLGADAVRRVPAPERRTIQVAPAQDADPDTLPEPAIWISLLAGFTLTGAALRARGGSMQAV